MGAAEVYGGFCTGNPVMMLDGCKKVAENFEGAIDQVRNSEVVKAAAEVKDKVCGGLSKLGSWCKGAINSLTGKDKKDDDKDKT